MQHILLIILVIFWIGFLAAMGKFLLQQVARAGFKKRLERTMMTDDELMDSMAEDDVPTNAEMEQSFVARIMGPVVRRFGEFFKASARDASGGQIRDMLEQAGHPLGMHYPQFLGLKMFCLLAFFGIGFITSFIAVPMVMGVAGLPADFATRAILQLLWLVVFSYLGFTGPTFWLRKTVNKRIKQIRKSMADVVDLIVLAIEAGLGFDQAVGQAVAKTTGPLTQELARVLDEIRVGKPQGEAFRDMSKRVRMPELTLLVAAIDQATRMGTGLSQALRLQSTEIRERRMAFIREQAGKLPVKMMMPLVFCIFPALFVVILGPAVVKMIIMSQNGELPS